MARASTTAEESHMYAVAMTTRQSAEVNISPIYLNYQVILKNIRWPATGVVIGDTRTFNKAEDPGIKNLVKRNI